MTLDECRRHPRFTYVSEVFVRRFVSQGSRVSGVVVESSAGGSAREMPVDTLVLAAGTLATSRISLCSIHCRGPPENRSRSVD